MRRTLDIGVKLYTRRSLPRFGRLLDASSSGAYVVTNATLPILARVHVELDWDRFQRGGRHRIAAHVVRVDARGIGIEWQEFAPLPVLALIDAGSTKASSPRHPHNYGGARGWRARTIASFRQHVLRLRATLNGE